MAMCKKSAAPKFAIGDKVFAKLKGYAPWPARVEGITDLTPGRITYYVYFFGTHDVAYPKEEDLCLYTPNKQKLGKLKARNSKFNKSVTEADAWEYDKLSVGLVGSNLEVDSIALPGIISSTNNFSSSEISDNHENPPIDKVVSNMEKEEMLLTLVLDLQNSLGFDRVCLKTCLKSLEKIGAMEMNKLIIMKNPEIVDTLFKVKNYVGVNSLQKTDLCDAEFKEQLAKVKVNAQVILNQIKSWFPCPYKKTFVAVFQEELENFQSQTNNLSQNEIFMLVDDTPQD